MNTLPFALYHGTSSLFLESIMTQGLGAERPVLQHSVIEMIAKMVDAFEARFPMNKEWMDYSWFAKRMVANEDGQRFSFRYGGGAYYSVCPGRALGFARKRHGSEAISALVELHEILHRLAPDLADSIYPCDHDLREFLAQPASPVILKVSRIDKGDLRAENGGPIGETLDYMTEIFFMKSKGVQAVQREQTNFECLAVVPPEHIEVFHADRIAELFV
ncbi:hypothetical protein IC617_08465 [Neiella sp. HB171785]|uniref:Uncharacterized protein n=1 Tax=Neiella litorisoli TaxID=2771431 RepID=A0A8J6QUT0_9GAMM|nr:hypothetical protein [Neiella litorisoli]MBD1389458.1 hypothetical protein [Neiella litorisoli]